MDPKFTYSVKTLGCKANVYDSLVLENELCDLGGVRSEVSPNVFILNSCTVTAEADRQGHREVAQAKKVSADVMTIVTGCYAEANPKKLQTDSNIDFIFGTAAKAKRNLREAIATKFGINIPASDLEDSEVYWGQLPSFRGTNQDLKGGNSIYNSLRTRAFLKVQEGCNDFCTYCIIPYGRGQSRSVPLEKVLAEVNRLVDTGVKEVVITGTNIADYGKEFNSSIEDLIENILIKTKIPRLRLSSLDPSEITDRILEIMGPHSRLMPHFHVSLQSAESRVLRAMKRHYRAEDVAVALDKIQKKNEDIYVGMDVIAGFPSETKEEHAATMSLLRNSPWTRLHVFPYSEREGTPALKIPGSVEMNERKQRSQELMLLSKERHEKFSKKFVGRTLSNVLFESRHDVPGEGQHYSIVTGHAENYLRVIARVRNPLKEVSPKNFESSLSNSLGNVQIYSAVPKPAQDWTLEGDLQV